MDLRTIELAVASQASVDAAIQMIVGENKRLDVVIHNAGHRVFGPAEAFTPEQHIILLIRTFLDVPRHWSVLAHALLRFSRVIETRDEPVHRKGDSR